LVAKYLEEKMNDFKTIAVKVVSNVAYASFNRPEKANAHHKGNVWSLIKFNL
jgi:hypothetical protein